jgi:hypothetical protein
VATRMPQIKLTAVGKKAEIAEGDGFEPPSQ